MQTNLCNSSVQEYWVDCIYKYRIWFDRLSLLFLLLSFCQFKVSPSFSIFVTLFQVSVFHYYCCSHFKSLALPYYYYFNANHCYYCYSYFGCNFFENLSYYHYYYFDCWNNLVGFRVMTTWYRYKIRHISKFIIRMRKNAAAST